MTQWWLYYHFVYHHRIGIHMGIWVIMIMTLWLWIWLQQWKADLKEIMQHTYSYTAYYNIQHAAYSIQYTNRMGLQLIITVSSISISLDHISMWNILSPRISAIEMDTRDTRPSSRASTFFTASRPSTLPRETFPDQLEAVLPLGNHSYPAHGPTLPK